MVTVSTIRVRSGRQYDFRILRGWFGVIPRSLGVAVNASDLEVGELLINRQLLELLQCEDEKSPLLLQQWVVRREELGDFKTEGKARNVGNLLGLRREAIWRRDAHDAVGTIGFATHDDDGWRAVQVWCA